MLCNEVELNLTHYLFYINRVENIKNKFFFKLSCTFPDFLRI